VSFLQWLKTIFGRPFVKRFALCHPTDRCPVCLSVLSVCNVVVYCDQTAEWMKMKLGSEVCLDPGHILLDGDPALLSQRGTAPIFGPCLLWPNGWMDQNSTW